MASAIGHIRPSERDTCETQVQVAAQSSKIATFQSGREITYKPAAACLAGAPKPAVAQSQPRVSWAPLPPPEEVRRLLHRPRIIEAAATVETPRI